ncbi:MAG TPA: maleylpyruvate isomerase family mycothiol-dependent enzyme, partial [Acidimicrobiales bacterium]|nr:maleylpyruvate isomerase family mycothiol-dependent enzyme [Acidimicrobiales bacterium]
MVEGFGVADGGDENDARHAKRSLRSEAEVPVEEVHALEEQQAELMGLLDAISASDWDRPSRCDGWSVADVVLHVAQTNEMAIGSATGRFTEVLLALTEGVGPLADVDDGAARMVDGQRGAPSAALLDRYQDGARTLCAELRAGDPHARITWVAGELSLRTLATTRLAETWIHTGDVAEALGIALQPAARLGYIARLAWRTLPYAFARDGQELHGPVAFDLIGPAGEAWNFGTDGAAATTIRGSGVDLCLVAARRV